jgi:hypothetical protein
MQIGLAMRAFWAVLFHASVAERVRQVLDGEPPAEKKLSTPTEPKPAESKPAPSAKTPARSEAITLLATLQREARLLDIVQEPLGNYSDAQIGAAARDVLRNCASVFERLFAVQPALAQEEGSTVEVPQGYDPLQYKLVGNISGDPPFRGKLVHHGWIATRCDLPAWTGGPRAGNVIAPIEIEVG